MANQKQLFELLEEQQEPFDFAIYLLENGCSVKRLQRICSHRPKRMGIAVGFLRSILTKLVHGKASGKTIHGNNHKRTESGRLSVLSCFSEISTQTPDMVSVYGSRALSVDHEWRCMELEDSKQLSPVSVLEFHNHRFKEENSSSTSSSDSPREALNVSAFSHYTNNPKKILSQERQLSKDCAREAHECLGPVVAENVINDKISSWQSLKGNVSSLTQLFVADISESSKGWSQFRPEVTEIGLEIELAIFEEIVDETLLSMLGLNCR